MKLEKFSEITELVEKTAKSMNNQIGNKLTEEELDLLKGEIVERLYGDKLYTSSRLLIFAHSLLLERDERRNYG